MLTENDKIVLLSNESIDVVTEPSTLEIISNELIDYFERHQGQIPFLLVVYVMTIIWILYLILYNSRVQGHLLSYLIQRFYFKDTGRIRFDSFSISFISGSIMFRNLHYQTGSYYLYVRDGCLVFRYWTRETKKATVRLKIKLYHFDLQFFNPLRSNSTAEQTNSSDENHRNFSKTDEQNSTVQADEETLIDKIRSLFPAIEIQVEHGRFSLGHHNLPYGLAVCFSNMSSQLTSLTPSRNAPKFDLMTLIYRMSFRHLRFEFFPIESYAGIDREAPPVISTSKTSQDGRFPIFECVQSEIEYEQDVPGKVTNEVHNERLSETSGVAWKIHIICNKNAKIAYGPWADRQREILWQYFLPTVHEESSVTLEPTVGQSRIFKNVQVKLSFQCKTKLDLFFINQNKLHELHVEIPSKNSSFEATFPFSTSPTGFQTSMQILLSDVVAQTNLSFKPFLQAEKLSISVNVHYPRLWNALQDWFIDIHAEKAQIYFVFQLKHFLQALINDWASKDPPLIHFFTPFIYHLNVHVDQIELLIPSNQGNWIDCRNVNNEISKENNFLSLCAKSLDLAFPLSFIEFASETSSIDLNIDVKEILGRLILAESNRMYHIVEGLDARKRFYTPNGIQSELSISKSFEKKSGAFDCGQIGRMKILVQILLHSASPVDFNRSELLYVQKLRSKGNRQTFHPKTFDYDIFNIEIDIGPVDLLLHGLFLKHLWWVKDNLFGWDQIYHDIHQSDSKFFSTETNSNSEIQIFDPRHFRPLMVSLRVALHQITVHLLHHTESEACPIGFCERLCVEMHTNLDETKLQVVFLPVNIYVEDQLTRTKSDQDLSTGIVQLSGFVLRGHAMLSHEGLPPERETLEYAWQMEILLGKVSARVTTIQLEKLLSFGKNFYLQMMEEEFALVRAPTTDPSQIVEKLKYNVLRFSLDSVEISLVETGNAIHLQIAPIRLCMCNLYSLTCKENLTFKLGSIQLRQFVRLHPNSWLEAGSIQIPELRLNGRLECYPLTLAHQNEQLEYLRRHDQSSQRLHFLYHSKSHVAIPIGNSVRRPSTISLAAANANPSSCACLGGSPTYFTLVSGEQFFRSSYRLSEQPSFGFSLFQPDVHVIYSHPIFEQKHSWDNYSRTNPTKTSLPKEEIFYPFDFCAQSNPTELKTQVSSPLSRVGSARYAQRPASLQVNLHKRSLSSIPLTNNGENNWSSTTLASENYRTPTARLSLHSTNAISLESISEKLRRSASKNSLSKVQRQISEQERSTLIDESEGSPDDSSSEDDSLAALEEILEQQQTQSRFPPSVIPKEPTTTVEATVLSASSPTHPSWINLNSQMKIPIQKSTLLCTSYIRYLSHYRSTTWSSRYSFPPTDNKEAPPFVDFHCVSHGFSCSFLSEFTPGFPTLPPRVASSIAMATSARARHSLAPTRSTNPVTADKELCIKFFGSCNILFTPLVLECLNSYIDAWQNYRPDPMSILDTLHLSALTQSNPPKNAVEPSTMKISIEIPKVNFCALQAGLAEDRVQLTELRTPIDIVTMSVFTLSSRQIQMETILSDRDQTKAAILKIQSITGQFRRLENDFSSLDQVQIHSIDPSRCRLQLQIPTDLPMHLPVTDNFSFIMNEFGLQKLSFRLIINRNKTSKPVMTTQVTQVDETATPTIVPAPPTKSTSKHKSRKKHINDPIPSTPPVTTVTSTSVSPSSTSSGVFDASIDQVWVLFPEPPNHSAALKRARNLTMASDPNDKKVFSYTRYDWNFLSTLSPTILSWYSVINRFEKPMKQCLHKQEIYRDAVLSWFLIGRAPQASLTVSPFNHLFTPKTKYFVSHPVCQWVNEMRKNFNRDHNLYLDLQPHLIPEDEILKQAIRYLCPEWIRFFKNRSTVPMTPPKSSSSKLKKSTDIENPAEIFNGPLRRRMTASKIDTRLDLHDEMPSKSKRSGGTFLDETLRRLQNTTASATNTYGYERLNPMIEMNEINHHLDESLDEQIGQNDSGRSTSSNSIEQLFKIFFDYARVELSVTSSIEPLFDTFGQTIYASGILKHFDVKIVPNQSIPNSSVKDTSVLALSHLNIQSVCRQSLEHDQLHSGNVQAGIRVRRIQQEVNLSLLRLIYQFYTVIDNGTDPPDNLSMITAEDYLSEDFLEFTSRNSRSATVNSPTVPTLFVTSPSIELIRQDSHLEQLCWKKLRSTVNMYNLSPETPQRIPILTNTRKQPQPASNPTTATKTPAETLLLSSFGWLIIDEVSYAASLGGLKVDGCMRKVQGSMTLSQRLRAMQSNTKKPNSTKYDGSLIVQIGSTSLSLKETLSDSLSNSATTTTMENPAPQAISVLDIIIRTSRGLASLQTRGLHHTLSAVTNIGKISMDVPLRPQEVHDLVNRAGRLITSYVQEFLPEDSSSSSTAAAAATTTANPDPTTEPSATSKLLQTPLNKPPSRRKRTLTANPTVNPLEAQQSVTSISKRSILEVHITAHCQGMTFSTTLLSALKAQYKIGVVEGVANLGSKTSKFTAIIHEHALHFLNNNNELESVPTVSSENHVRIDFPKIRCYGNYHNEQEQTRGQLNLRTKIDVVHMTITADFLAQLVFVSQVIIREINEILAKVSGSDQQHFASATEENRSVFADDADTDSDEKEQQITPIIYKIDVSIKGFRLIGQTPSNTVVKFENEDKKQPILIKVTNYDEENSFILYNKPIIRALADMKLSLGQFLSNGDFQDAAYFKTKLYLKNSFKSDDLDKEAYFICLTKPSFYWQLGAIDKGILFWLNYKNTYEHWSEQRGAFTVARNDTTHLRSLVHPSTAPNTTDALNLMFQLNIIDLGIAIPLQQLEPTSTSVDESADFLVFSVDQTTISACSCGAVISSGSFQGFCFRFAENFRQTATDWKPSRTGSNVILNACRVPSGQYSMHSLAKHLIHSKSPKWFLNLQWDMKGIDININSNIGKHFSQLSRTITSTQLMESTPKSDSPKDLSTHGTVTPHHQHSSDHPITMDDNLNEDVEKRKRLEYEYSIFGQKIDSLRRSNVSHEVLRFEEDRYKSLEKELLQAIKSEIQQRVKKQSNKSALTRDRNRAFVPSVSVPDHRRTQSHDFSQLNRDANGRRYSFLYAAALLSSSGLEHRRISQMFLTPSAIPEETTDEPTSGNLRSSSSIDSTATNPPQEITSTPAVDFELNIQIQIARGSCNLFTRRDLISYSPLKNSTIRSTMQQQQQQQQRKAIDDQIQTIDAVEYQVSKFSLPALEVDVHYKSKHENDENNATNKRGSLFCRTIIQAPSSLLILQPVVLDFLEQTLENAHPSKQKHQQTIRPQPIVTIDHPPNDNDHLDTMFSIEDQNVVASFPIDVVVSVFVQPCILRFSCLPAHPMECELHLPAVDIVLSSKRASPSDLSSTNEDIDPALGGISFSLCMKDFKLNVYHPFLGDSKVQLIEDMNSNKLQTRNALAVSVQSVSINISRIRTVIIDPDGIVSHSIQLSVTGRISRGFFEYDIRRLSEVLMFPTIWYNRALARRLFLGDDNLPTRIRSSPAVTRRIAAITNRASRKQARVLLAIQLEELNVSMRMSNVMGKVEWKTKDIRFTGSLHLSNEGKRTYSIAMGLERSTLQAEQGIVGGLIRLKNLRATGLIRQDLRDRSILVDASHIFDLLTDAIEIRLEYMGAPTLMGRICFIVLRLTDDRHSSTPTSPNLDSPTPLTLAVLTLKWSQLHLMITRSTTPDIIKMAFKLKEFFTNQIDNSRKLFSSIQHDFQDGAKRKNTQSNIIQKATPAPSSEESINRIKKHIGMNGGELVLQGHNLTLVVFHGLNFKSRQWALFSLNEPQITFMTDRGEKGDIHQKLFFYLGSQDQTIQANVKSRSNMASISKVTRNNNDAPSHVNIQEWFNYTSGSISAVGLREFPLMDDHEQMTNSSRRRVIQYDQTTESIFILPALQLHFQTRQIDGQVHCSFETEFYEHIMFTFNAEHFYFLHDLISSYIKAKEQTVNDKKLEQQRLTTTELPSYDETTTDDHRRFHCPDTKWRLQPTIKLMTAYGNEVEPFGADYILQKLGFRHARLTIPKWVQRGVMDPCEKSMTIVQLVLIYLLPERFKERCIKQ